MPTADTLERFIARVEQNAHVEAIAGKASALPKRPSSMTRHSVQRRNRILRTAALK